MDFRTVLNENEISSTQNKIDYQSKIGLMGSCFVENIGEKLNYYKFQNWVNPFGILFQPLAIEKALDSIVNKRLFSPSDLIEHDGLWHSLHHHSKFSNTDKGKVLSSINTALVESHEALKTSSHFIITLGTAWVYHHIETNQLVANCHKIPQKEFVKRLLTIEEITSSLEHSKTLVKSLNPNIEIIITLSPVRHLKDGMIASARSKALLLTAIHEVTGVDYCHYFPSYEILQDDLRDYRFYNSDMLHPNESSVLYIWEYFVKKWMSPSNAKAMALVNKIQKGLKHKAFNPKSKKHLSFVENLKKDKELLLKKYAIKL